VLLFSSLFYTTKKLILVCRMKKWLKTGSLCLLWYLSSTLNNILGKQVLTTFPHPMTLTLIQLFSITTYSIPLLHFYVYKNQPPTTISTQNYKIYIIPLAIGKFLASVSSHFSIWSVPVSYAHTVKATMPLFTIALTKILFNTQYSTQTYLSLLPIVLGVTIASLTELNFNTLGLITALISTFFFSLQNVFSKKLLKSTKLHQFELLSTLARISFIIFIPIYVIFDNNLISASNYVVILLFLDGLLSFLQNILAFSFLNLVTPLTYSVGNASKRIFIIVFSVVFFGNHVSFINFIGVLLAVGGVFLYNSARSYDKVKILPLHINNNNV